MPPTSLRAASGVDRRPDQQCGHRTQRLHLDGWEAPARQRSAFTRSTGSTSIKNGTVRRFLKGIFLKTSGGSGNVVDNIRADKNTLVGIQSEDFGSAGCAARSHAPEDRRPRRECGCGRHFAAGAGRGCSTTVTDTTKQGPVPRSGSSSSPLPSAVSLLPTASRARTRASIRRRRQRRCRSSLIASVASPLIGCTDSGNPQPPVLTASRSPLPKATREGDRRHDPVTDADSTNLVGASA